MQRGIVTVALIAFVAGGCREAEPPRTPETTAAPAPPPRATCTPAPTRLCPHDDASRDPSFLAYRTQLLAVIDEKDKAKLLPLVDPHIRTSFGEGGGVEDLRVDDRFWTELAQAVRLGGAFRDGMYWAPYVYVSWPENVDAFEHVAAIREQVPIRAQPNDAAEIVARADWDILHVVERNEQWLRTDKGWVRTEDVRSPVGYRAGFSKRSGAWKLEAFVAGD